ncbi:hypothetical protein CCACVL1_09745 [Corchorus capsularis]|uniref:Uncharacterized protein n=1 Tax=Corchorus capsularis TaxID=210143 RepID=A0A1R3IUF2_COCAP|nr:hypothetical protein CCACVL1_09745 [Corchorus capsularis]
MENDHRVDNVKKLIKSGRKRKGRSGSRSRLAVCAQKLEMSFTTKNAIQADNNGGSRCTSSVKTDGV